MTVSLWQYVLVATVAAGFTYVSVPIALRFKDRLGVFSSGDSFHEETRAPVPLIGGLAMFLGFFGAILFARMSPEFSSVFAQSQSPVSWFGLSEFVAIILAATIATAVGFIDDRIDITPPAKMAGIALAAGILVLGGINIIWFRIPFLDVFVVSYDLTFLLTMIWILGMANAINFIDGLDGLALGVVGIGALAFTMYGLKMSEEGLLQSTNMGPLVAAIVVGICAGLLPWNFHPAKVFMGDSGSMLLGVLMGASTVAVGGRVPDPFSGQAFFFYAPMIVPLLILGVPIVDTAFAIIRRASSGQGVTTADKDHLHHRLMRLGHGHRRSVAILWAWTALLSLLVLYPIFNDGEGDALVPIAAMVMGLILYLGLLVFTLRRGPNAPAAQGGIRVSEAGGSRRN